MPWINIIRGERVEPAPYWVRPPVYRLRWWMVLAWTLGKALNGVLRVAVRYWYITAPVLLVWILLASYGPLGVVVPVLAVGFCGGLWWLTDRRSFFRYAWFPVVGVWFRFRYRRRWRAAMATAGLAVRYERGTVIPLLGRVRAHATGVEVTVRMVSGQIPDDFAAVGERLASTFGARGCRVTPHDDPDRVLIALFYGDPLREKVGPLPVPAAPDFTALPLGVCEDGQVYCLRLSGTQVLIAGATGAGKGSVIWSAVAALAGGIRSGLVKVWAFDPKGGMELGGGQRLFARFFCTDFAEMADGLEAAVTVVRERAARLRGVSRQHVPTIGDPLYLLVIDELAALTAYCPDRKARDRINDALALILSQSRAVGVHVLAALQDPRKHVLQARSLFPTRIALRLAEEGEVDMVLGDGMRDRGAVCDRIPMAMPGVGFVVVDGDPTPVRVRFSYLTDEHIAVLCRDYAPPGGTR